MEFFVFTLLIIFTNFIILPNFSPKTSTSIKICLITRAKKKRHGICIEYELALALVVGAVWHARIYVQIH